MSPNGKAVLFSDQSSQAGANYAVYMRTADGAPPVRLGEGFPVDFSPDGASALAVLPSDPPRLVIYPTGAGVVRDVVTAKVDSYDYASTRFAENGRSVVYCGGKAGQASRCYLHDLASGTEHAVTPEGTDRGMISPDGRTVVARGTDGRYRRYPSDGSASQPVAGLDAFDDILSFRPDGRTLLVYRPRDVPSRVESVDLATGQRALVRELAPADRVGAVGFYGCDLADDEKSYVYCLDRSLSALYAVTGVR